MTWDQLEVFYVPCTSFVDSAMPHAACSSPWHTPMLPGFPAPTSKSPGTSSTVGMASG